MGITLALFYYVDKWRCAFRDTVYYVCITVNNKIHMPPNDITTELLTGEREVEERDTEDYEDYSVSNEDYE